MKLLLERYRSVLYILATCLFLLGVYLPKLRNYQLSGDDLVLTVAAPTSPSERLAKFTHFADQYRPLTHNLFSVYKVLLPNSDVIWAVNFVITCVVVSLFFFNLKRFIDMPFAALVSAAVFLSPIFYYHFFSISALNNFLMLIWGLLLLLLVKVPHAENITLSDSRRVQVGAALLALSIFSKESFLLNLGVFALILWQNTTKKQFITWGGATLFAIVGYFALRFSQYNAGGEYALSLSLSQKISTVIDMVTWLFAYPRGWQYGAPEAKSLLTYAAVGVTALSMAVGFFFARPLKNWKSVVTFFILLGLSLVPFLAIERALPFYLDTALLCIVVWVIVSVRNEPKQVRALVSGLLALSFVLQFLVYYPQWQKYSFIANANETALQFQQTLESTPYRQFDRLCIINHVRGSWGSMDGQAAKYLYGYSGAIISEPTETVPAACQNEQSLLLKNDGWNYQVIK